MRLCTSTSHLVSVSRFFMVAMVNPRDSMANPLRHAGHGSTYLSILKNPKKRYLVRSEGNFGYEKVIAWRNFQPGRPHRTILVFQQEFISHLEETLEELLFLSECQRDPHLYP